MSKNDLFPCVDSFSTSNSRSFQLDASDRLIGTGQRLQNQESALFVPDPDRSFSQPAALQLEDVQNLTQRLAAANRKIDEYANLMASLTADLKHYRDTICDSCKDKVLLATSSMSLPQSAVISTESRTSTGATQTPSDTESPFRSSTIRIEMTGIELSSDPESPFRPSMTAIEPSLPLTLSLPDHESHPSIRGNPETRADPPLNSPSLSILDSDPSTTSLDLPLFPIPTAPIVSVEYSPEFKQTLDLYVAKTFEFEVRVTCVKFSRDGNYLAVGLANEELHIYDILTMSKSVLVGRGTSVIYSEAMTSKTKFGITSARFSPDSKYIATVGMDEIRIWAIKRKQVLAIFKGHTFFVKCMDFSHDGRFLASASYDGTVCLWSIRDGSSRQLSHARSSYFNSVAFSPDGRCVAAGNNDGHLRIWEARTGHLLKKWEAHTDGVASVAYKPDGKGIASGGFDCIWKSWDLSSLQGRQLNSSRHLVETTVEMDIFAGKNTSTIRSICFSSDSRWILTSSDRQDPTSRIWDAETGALVCALRGHVWADFCPAGQYLTAFHNYQALLWRYREVDK